MITDYKTSYGIDTLSDLQRDMQARTYALVVNKEYGYRRFLFDFHYVRKNIHQRFALNADIVEDTERKLKRFTQKVIALIADPETNWRAMTGDRCPICDFPCPLENTEEVTLIRDSGKATEVGESIQVMRQKIVRMQAPLKEYVVSTGPLITGTGEYILDQTPTLSFKVGDLLEFLTGKGIYPSPFSVVDTDYIRKLPDGDLKSAVVSLAKQDLKQYFKFSRETEGDTANVKGKGVVVFSMCSHAGVVNVLRDAQSVFAGVPLHAVMGGFHLAGKGVEAIIPETILDLLAFGLKRIVPAHCTGWRAFTALAGACDEGVLMPSAVGRTFIF